MRIEEVSGGGGGGGELQLRREDGGADGWECELKLRGGEDAAGEGEEEEGAARAIVRAAFDAKRAAVGVGARMLFYPTLVYNVVRNQCESHFHWWDQVDEHVLLGAVPFPSDVLRLQKLGVCGVVTLNESYERLVPKPLYEAHGIENLVLPTRDYLYAPSFDSLCKDADFIHNLHVSRCVLARGRRPISRPAASFACIGSTTCGARRAPLPAYVCVRAPVPEGDHQSLPGALLPSRVVSSGALSRRRQGRDRVPGYECVLGGLAEKVRPTASPAVQDLVDIGVQRKGFRGCSHHRCHVAKPWIFRTRSSRTDTAIKYDVVDVISTPGTLD